jgi:uncharacterized protein (TIGR03382 family)
MRNKTLISSMVAAAVAVAGSASAGIAGMTFDSFTVAQSESNLPGPISGINWASPASSQPIFGASGTRAAFAYDNGSGTSTSSVGGGTATFTTTGSGGQAAGLYYSGDAQDLTGYTFSFYLNSNVATDGQLGFFFDLESVGGYSSLVLNYTVAGTYTVDLSTMKGVDLTAITSIAIGIYTAEPGSATVSNFTYTPAPGALALLGVAGLAGARRRRA